MPRNLRVQYPGAVYHVTARGNGRQAIFYDDADRERLLERLAESVESYGVRVYLYCLMSNHVHLVLETPGANLSRFMQSVLTGYTVYYNRRHKTCGHLFQGRYGAKLVGGDEYLLRLSRYVHLNPVHVGAAKRLELRARIKTLRAYGWSSYQGYIGSRRRQAFVEYGPVLGQMGRGRQARSYRRYVESALAETDEEFK
ncbi:MAG: transposase, partial [Acidobacteriota bacterium]